MKKRIIKNIEMWYEKEQKIIMKMIKNIKRASKKKKKKRKYRELSEEEKI